MFSGIVERMAEVVDIRTDRQNKDFTLRADFCRELKIDQSIAHNGVCLTVVDIRDDTYTVTAMKETLDRSNLGLLAVGDLVNLERSMKPDALLDGHIVQGHVDQTAVCTAREDADGSWYYTFAYEPQGGGLCTVEKGSVTVNGVSLTVCDSKESSFRVAIIPYTFEHTNFCRIGVGSVVNLERSMKPDALLDGHIVQGHVDQTAVCTAKEDADGSWYFTFEYQPQGGGLCTVEKGSVTVNGVSLTVCDSKESSFRVAIIPYTFEHTNFCRIEVGSVVNLEFDIVGKYIARLMQQYTK